MENLDIYILTSIVATLFIAFGVTVYREFTKMEKEEYRYNPTAKRYGRDGLFDLAVRMFEEEGLTPKVTKKKKVYKAIERTIADMESDGVYFSENKQIAK